MRASWRRRVLVTASAWLVLTAAAYWLQMDPAVPVLAGIVGAVAALFWLVTDVSGEVQPAFWRGTYAPTPRARGVDPRLAYLRRATHDAVDLQGRLARRPTGRDHLRLLLADLAGERLQALHGVDPDRDQEAARRLLGHELSHYLLSSPDANRPISRQQLTQHLSRIEAL